MKKDKTIEQTYQKLTDIQHVLLRAGMYIGSVSPRTDTQFLYDGEKIWSQEVEYIPGFFKLFDEILSNSLDEHRRSPKLNEIKVTIDQDNGTITVLDNGGIPVVKHKVHNEWVPEMVFSNMKAGSNFDDTEQRTQVGLNGVGSVITNIFSTKFSVATCDGKNSFYQVFTNNMHDRTKPKISTGARGYTEISFTPDLKRFGLKEIDDTAALIMFKRCLDAVACNTKVTVKFIRIKDDKKTSQTIRFKSFEDYVKLYTSDYVYEESKDWKIAFAKSETGFTNISFVNSVQTRDGGSHVDYITSQLVSDLREMIQKKHKVDVKPNEIKGHMTIFVESTIINPSFSSQTKEKLVTEPKDFGTSHSINDKTVKHVFKSEIIQSVLDWIEKKEMAQERAELRKLNKSLDRSRIPKLIDAEKKGDRGPCILGLYEGNSAASQVTQYRDSQIHGAFPLRGKFINVSEMKNTEIIKNEEAVQLIGALGLRLGEEPTGLRYGRIYIYTDADQDGNSIAGLLINFFNKFWPELFDQGRIYKVMTPLVVAKKGSESLNFYTNDEFDEWMKKSSSKSWDIEYKKGLGSLEAEEYEQIIINPKVIKITNDPQHKQSLNDWFGPDSAPRKERILRHSK